MPAFRFATELLMKTFKFSPTMLAFKLNAPLEFNVRLVNALPCFKMSAPLSIVRLPEPFCVHTPIPGQAFVLALTSITTLFCASAAEMTRATPASMFKSMGSSNHWPALPLGADVLMDAVGAITSCVLELVSINPPSPPMGPPMALSAPATEVLMLDQTLI